MTSIHISCVWDQKMFSGRISGHFSWNQWLFKRRVKGEDKIIFWFHRGAMWQLIRQHGAKWSKSVQNLRPLCIFVWWKKSISTENHFSRKCWVFGIQGLIFGCSISIQSTLTQSTSETRAIQSNLIFFQHTILSKHLPVSTVYHQTHPSWRISCHITLGRTLQERNATNSKS